MAKDTGKSMAAGVGAKTALRAGDAGKGGTDTLDVSHLRPLSEGVLHRAGLHGGADTKGHVRDLRGLVDGAFDLDANDLPSDEPHVRLMRLEQEYGGIASRRVNADGSVVLSFSYGDDDATSAKAATTVEAVDALIEKMHDSKAPKAAAWHTSASKKGGKH